MLKHLLFCAILAAPAIGLAQTPSSLTFELADGSRRALPAQGLSITFDSATLVAAYPGGTFETPTDAVSKFYFSAQPSGLDAIEAEGNEGGVEVYAISGVRMGTFLSAEAARAALPAGLYIIKAGNRTFKTAVKR